MLKSAHVILKETVIYRADQRDQLKENKHHYERNKKYISPAVMFVYIGVLMYSLFHPFFSPILQKGLPIRMNRPFIAILL